MFPHEESAPYRRPVLLVVTMVAALVGIVAPGQSIGMRLASPFMALAAVGGGYAVGWLVLKFQALIWGRIAPRAVRGLCLAFFYLFVVGTLLNLLLYPSIAPDLKAEGISFANFVAMLPAGLGAAAGAYRVYLET
jgi:hypothetical protein